MGEVAKYEPQCLNCGNHLNPEDEFCARCGQRTRGTKVPLSEFISDFFQDYFTVDSKFFKSIFLLMAVPGGLTKRYNEGLRKRYIAPFRMYLFTSFVYFFLLALSVSDDQNVTDAAYPQNSFGAKAMILDSLIDHRVTTIQPDSLRSVSDSLDQAFRQDLVVSFGGDPDSIEIGETGLGKRVEQFLKTKAKRANENPDDFLRSLMRSASITLFFLLPVFALILWAFHFRRAPYYVQNLVHSVHLHTFVFALFSIYLALKLAFETHISGIVAVLILVYLVWSMRTVYSQSIFRAIWKTILVLAFYFLVILFTLLPVLLGALAGV